MAVKVTIQKINRYLATVGLELVKHPDYFYFIDITEDYSAKVPPSVYTRCIRDLTFDQWMEHSGVKA